MCLVRTFQDACFEMTASVLVKHPPLCSFPVGGLSLCCLSHYHTRCSNTHPAHLFDHFVHISGIYWGGQRPIGVSLTDKQTTCAGRTCGTRRNLWTDKEPYVVSRCVERLCTYKCIQYLYYLRKSYDDLWLQILTIWCICSIKSMNQLLLYTWALIKDIAECPVKGYVSFSHRLCKSA